MLDKSGKFKGGIVAKYNKIDIKHKYRGKVSGKNNILKSDI